MTRTGIIHHDPVMCPSKSSGHRLQGGGSCLQHLSSQHRPIKCFTTDDKALPQDPSNQSASDLVDLLTQLTHMLTSGE